jgi:polypeptide N-acetylgalactosaminyltransferase
LRFIIIKHLNSLIDNHLHRCKTQPYYEEESTKLKATSVIICFHNEAWSVLLRSVHSVLDRSPEELISEVILVDDFSDMGNYLFLMISNMSLKIIIDHLKTPLTNYFKKYPKVKVVRADKREGLIRARLLGAKAAKGPVLTFLDSHVEATTGWLEPLLHRITKEPTTVVCPVIDVIDDDSLEYHYSDSKGTSVGGFDWNLQFTWHVRSFF